MAGPNVVISVLADTAKFGRDFDSLGSRMSAGLANIAKVGVVALAAGAVAVTGFLASSIKAAGDVEKIGAQTTAVLQSTAGAAGQTEDSIGRLATKLSQLSGIDDDLIQSGENVLLTFTNIKGVNFDAATQSALDMSTALGTDLQSSAILVGKALNDPIKGLTALTRVGVAFTDQQRKQIQAMQEAGDVAGAQQIILAELAKEFGGSAEAFGNTWQGAVGKVKTAFGNIQEAIGTAFLPALTAGATSIAGVLNSIGANPKFQAWLDSIGPRLTAAFQPITDLLVAVGKSDDPFGTLFDGLEKISPLFSIIRTLFDALQPQLASIEGGFQKLADALGSGIAEYGPQLADAIGQIVAAIIPLLPQVLALIPSLLQLVPPLLQLATEIIPPLASLLSEVLPPAISGITFLLGLLGPALGFVIDGLNGAFAAFKPLGDFLAGGLSLPNLVSQLGEIPGPFGDVERAAIAFGTAIGDGIRTATNAVVGFVHDLISNATDALNFVRSMPQQIIGFFAGAGSWLVNAGRDLVQGFINGVSSLAGKIGSFFLNSLPGWIVGPFKAALGIHSPSALFEGLGKMVPAGLINGVQSGLSAVRAAAGSMADAVTDGYSETPIAAGVGSRAPGAGLDAISGGVHIHLDGAVYLTQAEVGRAVQEALDEWNRINGGAAAA